MKRWRLILDSQPLGGARNMAIDEFLFNSLKEKGDTILRFYSWAKPTASLGYGQRLERVLDLEACRRLGIDVVRRLTGGKLVLHHQEITYSICSSDPKIFTESLAGSYRLISLGLMEGLKLLGLKPELSPASDSSYSRGCLPCFVWPAENEVTVASRKIIGSAQRRFGWHFLQHGSIPLQPQENLLREISRLKEAAFPLKMISLEEALGRPVTFGKIVPFFIQGLQNFFQIEFEERNLAEAELEEVERLELTRYANPAWTLIC